MKPVTMKPEFWALSVALHTAFYQISGDEDCEETKERIKKIFFGSLYQRLKNTYFEWPQMRIGSFRY